MTHIYITIVIFNIRNQDMFAEGTDQYDWNIHSKYKMYVEMTKQELYPNPHPHSLTKVLKLLHKRPFRNDVTLFGV